MKEAINLASFLSDNNDIKCEIYGTKGKITIATNFHGQSQHIISVHGFADQLIQNEHVGFGYFHEIEHVNECLCQGLKGSFLMPLKMSIDLMELMDEIRNQ